MSHWRSEYRSLVRVALAADPRLGSVTQIKSWSGDVDDATLPVLGVVTPSEAVVVPARGQSERGTLLQVVLRRAGGENIDDDLDDDSAAIEACVVGALWAGGFQCRPEEVSMVTTGVGKTRIGTVLSNFRVTSWRAFGISA